MPQASDRIPLAGSDMSIPPLGVGTWAWGDESTWGMGGYDTTLTDGLDPRGVGSASIEAGVVLFDTAEVYGKGESERIIGRLLAEDPGVRSRVVIASKFMPMPAEAQRRARRCAPPLRGVARAARHRRHRPLPDPRSDLAAVGTARWPRRWPPRTARG